MSTTTSQDRRPAEDPLARALGWASLGLGAPQIAAPGAFAHAIGVRDDARTRFWTRAVGVRELMAAAGILKIGAPRPTEFVWSRVAGDAMDLAMLAEAWRAKREGPRRLAAATAAVVGIGAADLYEAAKLSYADEITEDGHLRVRASITVQRSAEEVYAFWHDFQNLPRFMDHLESVQASNGRSHWKATAPAGRTVEWDAELVRDDPGQLIEWRSLAGSEVQNAGSVRFVQAPGDRGTEIHLDLRYAAPGGPLGAAVAKLFGEEPRQQVKDDLRRFKQVMETGEVVRSDGSPEGQTARRNLRQRPAHPLEAGAAT
jgi:uncharacterized membrane protein